MSFVIDNVQKTFTSSDFRAKIARGDGVAALEQIKTDILGAIAIKGLQAIKEKLTKMHFIAEIITLKINLMR